MDDLHDKVVPDNTFIGRVMGKCGFGESNNNSGAFLDFHHLAIGGTLYEHGLCHIVNRISIDRQRASKQIERIVISSWSRIYFLYVLNKRGNGIGFK